jgi:hypothetical protein
MRGMNSDLIVGYSWEDIQRAQRGGKLSRSIEHKAGDYGADPIGDGRFRMVPSGDIVDWEERNRRLARKESDHG